MKSGAFIRIYELTAANDNLVHKIAERMRIEAQIELKRRDRSRTVSGEAKHGKNVRGMPSTGNIRIGAKFRAEL